MRKVKYRKGETRKRGYGKGEAEVKLSSIEREFKGSESTGKEETKTVRD